MSVRTVEWDGIRIRVRTALRPRGRAADAPALVLVHGIGMSHLSFTRLARALHHSYPLVAVDLPGFGGSSSGGRTLGVEGQATAVAAVLRTLELRGCVIVGHSMGTQVAVELTRREPHLVRSVVLIGPVVDARRPSLLRQVAALLRDTVRERPSMNAVVIPDYLRSIPQFLRELRPMLDYPMLERVAQLRVPVLVARGTQDPIVLHDWARHVAAAATVGQLVETPGPHHVQEHASEALARAIEAFIGGAPGASRP